MLRCTGANFSFHKEKARPMPESGPVGSVYKKADPRAHINQSRDKFWSEQEVPPLVVVQFLCGYVLSFFPRKWRNRGREMR